MIGYATVAHVSREYTVLTQFALLLLPMRLNGQTVPIVHIVNC